MCGSENWTLSKSERMQIEIETFFKDYLDTNLQTRIRNIIIRNELQIYASGEKIKEYKTKWYNHISRRDFPRLTQKGKIYQLDGQGIVGWPMKWNESL
jgi:hypothetical protein